MRTPIGDTPPSLTVRVAREFWQRPEGTPAGAEWRYGLGYPFQAARGVGAVLLHIHVEGTPYYGYNNGSDVVLFDTVTPGAPLATIVVARNEYNIATAGGMRMVLKSPAVGGFVPRDALKHDARPHPAAGTGFAFVPCHEFEQIDEEGFTWRDPDRLDMVDLYSLAFDESGFRATQGGRFLLDGDSTLNVGGGWSFLAAGLGTAIPDGDDLLMPLTAVRDGLASCGVSRWVFDRGSWRPSAFSPTTPPAAITDDPTRRRGANANERIPWSEPSLVRGRDGSLIFCARGSDTFVDADGVEHQHLVQLWKSSDGGRSWHVLSRTPGIRQIAPVTVHRTPGGSLFVVTSPRIAGFTESPSTCRGRESLVLWQVDDQRGLHGEPVRVTDAFADFGPPFDSEDAEVRNCWLVDHPMSACLHLRDGRWHTLLTYRVVATPLYRSLALPPSPASGCHIAEVLDGREPRAEWTF